MRLYMEAHHKLNRSTGEVLPRVTLANMREVLGLSLVETETGYVAGGWWGNDALTQKRAEALAHTWAVVDESGAWSVEGPASAEDRATIAAALDALPRADVLTERARAVAEYERLVAYLRAVAGGTEPVPPFVSRRAVIDELTDAATRNILGL